MSKEHVGTRLELDEVARVDALIETMSTPGREMTRSKVLRVLILHGLAEAESGVGSEPGHFPVAQGRKRGSK